MEAEWTGTDPDYMAFVHNFKKLTGIDLALYKEAQMKRRLTTFRERKGYDTFAVFFQAVKNSDQLLEELLDRMTINVSEFWRNPQRWVTLEKQVIPELLSRNSRLKCWSAACSTGEEPYTLAMILANCGALSQASILATDLDEQALKQAKAGVYHERSLKDVPATYKAAYFSKHGDVYVVSDELKRSVRFEQGNLLSDPFDSNFDLIICRNVLIYFTEEAKKLLYQKFSKALAPGGILFVGATEQILSPAQYGLVSTESFFYQKAE